MHQAWGKDRQIVSGFHLSFTGSRFRFGRVHLFFDNNSQIFTVPLHHQQKQRNHEQVRKNCSKPQNRRQHDASRQHWIGLRETLRDDVGRDAQAHRRDGPCACLAGKYLHQAARSTLSDHSGSAHYDAGNVLVGIDDRTPAYGPPHSLVGKCL